MFPFMPSLLLILLLAAPALLTTSASHELQVRGQRTPRDAKQDSIKVVISEGCANQGDSSDVSQGGKEIDLTPGSPLVLTHKIKLVPSGSGLGAGSCGCEADFAALRERLERLEREVSSLREKCGGAEGGCCTSKESKGPGCSIKPGLDGCPNECSDQGRCVDGKCVCFTGFSGPDCSMSNCPGNCNDNGRCVNGQCVCDPGFTGSDCSQRGCPDNCNNHGRCVNGECVCNPGFTGPDCSQRGCPDNCNNRGRCVNGRCVCDTGFAGPSCSDQSCPGNCNNRGRCVNGQCVCNPGFTGPDCSKKACPNNCSDRGRCMNGKCVCDSGFTGADCSADSCPGNCKKRGRCINGQCVCNPGFTGPDCSKRACPDDCNDRGRCVNGKCVCDSGFTGADCSETTCPGNCNNRGRCINGECVCDDEFSGPDCSERTCPNDCSDQGRCVNGKCVCDSGFTGADCSETTCPGNCNNRGRCINGECVCDDEFSGPDCSERTCPNDCSDQGRCVNGKCVCDSGFTGADCSETTCPGNCNNRGRCINGECVCDDEFSGPDCSERTCPNDCSDQGRCVNGKCVCDSGFTGDDCSEKSCPGNCNNRGRCVNGQCVCEDGFTGADCSEKACPNNCSNRGRCVNGKCVCDVGFAGPDCAAKGCPNNCNNKGRCVKGRCVCRRGFTGPDCSQCESGMTGPNCDTVMSGVSQLSTRDITETSVTLFWTAPHVQYDTYYITFTSQKESDQQINVQVEGSLTTFTQTGLAAGQDYTASITGEIDGRRGAESSTEFMTLISGPTNLRAVKTTSTSAVVQWEQSQGEIHKYRLTVTPNDRAGKSQEMVIPAGQDSVHIQQLEAGHLYDITLVAEKGKSQSKPATTQVIPGKLLPGVTTAALTMQITLAPGQDVEDRDQEVNPSPEVQVFDQQRRREDGSEADSIKVGSIDGPNRNSSTSVTAKTKPLVSRMVAVNGTRPRVPGRSTLYKKPNVSGPFRFNTTRVVPGRKKVGPGPLKKPPVGQKKKAPTLPKKLKPGVHTIGDRKIALTVRDPSVDASTNEMRDDKNPAKMSGSDSDTNRQSSSEEPTVSSKEQPDVGMAGQGNDTAPVSSEPTRTVQSQEKKCMNKVKVTHIRLPHRGKGSGCRGDGTVLVGQTPGSDQGSSGADDLKTLSAETDLDYTPDLLHKLLTDTFDSLNITTFSVHLSNPSNLSVNAETVGSQIVRGLKPLAPSLSESPRLSSSHSSTLQSLSSHSSSPLSSSDESGSVGSNELDAENSRNKPEITSPEDQKLPPTGKGGAPLFHPTPAKHSYIMSAGDRKPPPSSSSLASAPSSSSSAPPYSSSTAAPSSLLQSSAAPLSSLPSSSSSPSLAPPLSSSTEGPSLLTNFISPSLSSSPSSPLSSLSSSDKSGSVGSNEQDADNSRITTDITSPEDRKLPPLGKGGAPLFRRTPAKHGHIRHPRPNFGSFQNKTRLNLRDPHLSTPHLKLTLTKDPDTRHASTSESSASEESSLVEAIAAVKDTSTDKDWATTPTSSGIEQLQKKMPTEKGRIPMRRLPPKGGYVRRINFGPFQNRTRPNLRLLPPSARPLNPASETKRDHISSTELPATVSKQPYPAKGAGPIVTENEDRVGTRISSTNMSTELNQTLRGSGVPSSHRPTTKIGYFRRPQLHGGRVQNKTRINLRPHQHPQRGPMRKPLPTKNLNGGSSIPVGSRFSQLKQDTTPKIQEKQSGSQAIPMPTQRVQLEKNTTPEIQDNQSGGQAAPMPTQRVQLEKNSTPETPDNQSEEQAAPMPTQRVQLEMESLPEIQDNQLGEQATPMPTQGFQIEQSGEQHTAEVTPRAQIDGHVTTIKPQINKSEEGNNAPVQTTKSGEEENIIPDSSTNIHKERVIAGKNIGTTSRGKLMTSQTASDSRYGTPKRVTLPKRRPPMKGPHQSQIRHYNSGSQRRQDTKTHNTTKRLFGKRPEQRRSEDSKPQARFDVPSSSGVTREPLDYVGVTNRTSDGFTLIWDSPEEKYKNFVVTSQNVEKDEGPKPKKSKNNLEEDQGGPKKQGGNREEEGKRLPTKETESENGGSEDENRVPESVSTQVRKIQSSSKDKPVTGSGEIFKKVVPGSARSFQFENLPPQTEYTVTLLGKGPGLLSKLHKLVISTGPEPPTDIVFSEVTDNSLTVSWTKPKTPISGFKVTYTHTEDGEPVSVSVDSDDSTVGLSQLSPGSSYEVSVISILGLDESDPIKDFVTTLPDPPTDLRAVNITDTKALLLWRPALATVDKYAIVYGSGTDSELRVTVSGNAAEQQLSGLEGSTTYTVTITSQLGSKESSVASTSFTTTGGSGRDGDGPRDLQANNVTPRTALLSWKPPLNPTGGYRLTYQTDGQELKEVIVDASLTEYNLTKLHPGSKYTVQLQAEGGGRYTSAISTDFTTGTLRFPFPTDCSQELLNGIRTSGEVEIFPQGKLGTPMMVYCDMETDGGGWMVFQRRKDGSENFFRGWKDYTKGFGSLSGEFWLGLEAIHNLTAMTRMILRVDLRDKNDAVYAKYSTFEVAKRNYKLTVGGYSGTAGDSLSYHNQRIFSTKDRDLASFITRCAMSYRGGWWYKNCHEANLNGLYGISVKHQGIIWTTWRGKDFSIPFTEMKMRPAAFRG